MQLVVVAAEQPRSAFSTQITAPAWRPVTNAGRVNAIGGLFILILVATEMMDLISPMCCSDEPQTDSDHSITSPCRLDLLVLTRTRVYVHRLGTIPRAEGDGS